MSPASPEPPASDASRRQRIQELAARGPAGVGALLELLADPSWSVRREVVLALAALGDAAAEGLCGSLREQREDEARLAATVDALVGNQGKSVEARLIALADDENPQLVADVAQILGRRRGAGAYQALIALTTHADDNVAVAALEALGRLGGRPAVDALIACIDSSNFFRVFPAIDVLGRSGDPRAVEPLAMLLRDSRYALEAARALGRTADRRAVGPLAALLAAPSASHVRVASLALVELCDRHAQLYGSEAAVRGALHPLLSDALVRRLGQSLSGADKPEKSALCRLLGYSQSEAATSFLLQMLDGDPEVGAAAGRALIEVGRGSEGGLFAALLGGDSARRKVLLPLVVQQHATQALIVCLRDPSEEVRVLVCDALARTGGVAAVPALFALLEDGSQRVVHAAVGAIQSLGSAQTEPLALAAAASARTAERRAALRVLAYFGYASALPLFTAAIAEGEPRLRDIALQGLALIDQPEAAQQLLEVARGADASARAAAMRALGQTSDTERITRCLLDALSDPEAWVRYYACQALGKLGVKRADEPLRRLLDDGAGQVRVAAIEALSHLNSSRAVEALRSYATHSDLDLRRAALVGLGLVRDRASIPELTQAALAADSATRLVALSALATIDAPEVVPTLLEAASAPIESVRVAAINLLAARPKREAADALVALLLRDIEHELLLRVLAAPLEGRIPALQAALEQVSDAHAPLLTSCLSRLQSQAATTALYETLASSNVAARRAAVAAVAALGTREAHTALERLASVDVDADVRRACLLHLAS